MIEFKPWKPWRYVFDGLLEASKPTYEYRAHQAILSIRMGKASFEELMRHVEAAEVTTRAILKMMDRKPNVLTGKEVED